jgi:hypothetical protein|tara:strand:+ start:886 stop:1041 length:156 start_codon:yes stop_codon:yes gene_type:complete
MPKPSPDPAEAPRFFDTRGDHPLGRTYVAVLLVEVATLMALWFFASYFTGP